MQTRPPNSILVLVLLVGAGAMLAAAVNGMQSGHGVDPGRGVMMAGCAVLATLGGFKVGRLLAAGQLFSSRVCRSCNAKRTTAAAFCESCHRRD